MYWMMNIKQLRDVFFIIFHVIEGIFNRCKAQIFFKINQQFYIIKKIVDVTTGTYDPFLTVQYSLVTP